MIRTLFIAIFLSLYTLVLGPPLLIWTWLTKNPDLLYWAGVKGVMFFVRAVGESSRCGPRAHPLRGMPFLRESHQFGRRPCRSGSHPAADCHPAQGIFVSLAYCGNRFHARTFYSRETRIARIRRREHGESHRSDAQGTVLSDLSRGNAESRWAAARLQERSSGDGHQREGPLGAGSLFGRSSHHGEAFARHSSRRNSGGISPAD